MSKLYDIYLTKSQIDKYSKTGEVNLSKNIFKKPNVQLSISNKKYNDLKNEKIDLIEIKVKKGGFIPLVPLIAGVAGVASAISSVYNSINNKKTNDELVKQRKRQNDILEKQNQEGKPIQVNTIGAEGKKLIGGGLKKKSVKKSNSKSKKQGGYISPSDREIDRKVKNGGNVMKDFQKIVIK